MIADVAVLLMVFSAPRSPPLRRLVVKGPVDHQSCRLNRGKPTPLAATMHIYAG